MTSVWVSTAWLVVIGIFVVFALGTGAVTLLTVWGDRKVSEERQHDMSRLDQPRRRARRPSDES